MKTIEIDIFRDYKVSLGWFEGDKVISKNVRVNVDDNVKIKNAELEVECNTSGLGIEIWFNYDKVLSLNTDKELAEKVDIDVKPNTDNNIVIKVFRLSPFPSPVTAILNVKLVVTIETEVTQPAPPTQPTQPAQPTQPSQPTQSNSCIGNIIVDIATGVIIAGITYMLFRRKRR